MIQNIHAIAIDLDGTLLDTIPDLCGAVNLVLADLKFAPLEIDLVKTFVGKEVKGSDTHATTLSCAMFASGFQDGGAGNMSWHGK